MVSGGITKDGSSKSKAYPREVSRLKVNAQSALCVQCDMSIQYGCARVLTVTPKSSRNFACRKCEINIGEAVKQEESICEAETAIRFTYPGDRVSAGGGCETMTDRTRCR